MIIDNQYGDTIQYSNNYYPIPHSGDAGNENTDKLLNTPNASLKIINALHQGNYTIVWSVTDGCYGLLYKSQSMTVLDKTPPIPVLKDFYISNTFGGFFNLKAKTLDNGCATCTASTDNCTESSDLFFTFTRILPRLWEDPNPNTAVNEWDIQFATYGYFVFDPVTGAMVYDPAPFTKFTNGKAHRWHPNQRTSEKFVTPYLFENTISIKDTIYVWDKFSTSKECGDKNYNFGFYNLINNFDLPTTHIKGQITWAKNGKPLSNFDVNAYYNTDTFSTISDVQGFYEFNDSRSKFYLNVSRSDINIYTGLTTLDLVLIQRYLLGLLNFNDPYQIIAADINKSSHVTAADIKAGRDLILGKNLDNGNPFECLLKSYNFINIYNPFPELDIAKLAFGFNYNNIPDNLDWIVITRGDVNFSNEYRNGKELSIVIDDAFLNKGQELEIPVYAKDFNDVSGFQLSLEMSKLEVKGIISRAIKINEDNYNIVGGNLLISYLSSNLVTTNDGEILFKIKVKAKDDLNLANSLNINTSILSPEAYVGDISSVAKLNLQIRKDVKLLNQNFPNPFTEETTIPVNLNAKGDFNITITDLNGLIVYSKIWDGVKGLNMIRIYSTDIPVPGIYCYKVDTSESSDCKKMVRVVK